MHTWARQTAAFPVRWEIFLDLLPSSFLTWRTDQSPSDLIAAGNTAAMDRSKTAVVGPGDDHTKVVPTHRAVAAEIDSHPSEYRPDLGCSIRGPGQCSMRLAPYGLTPFSKGKFLDVGGYRQQSVSTQADKPKPAIITDEIIKTSSSYFEPEVAQSDHGEYPPVL